MGGGGSNWFLCKSKFAWVILKGEQAVKLPEQFASSSIVAKVGANYNYPVGLVRQPQCHRRYRDILYTNTFLYTLQSLYELSLYGTKFIRDKVYTGPSLYRDKVYTGTKFIRDKVHTVTKFIRVQSLCMHAVYLKDW
jgi:hypothetical protein